MYKLENKHIIIFDGVCNFCNSSVNFIIKRDDKNVFVFTPMQSNAAKNLIKKYEIKDFDNDTIVLIKNNKYYSKSDAALEITKDLSGFWSFFNIFKVLPPSFRNYFYVLLANNRYSLFGKKDSCMIPKKELTDKFLTEM